MSRLSIAIGKLGRESRVLGIALPELFHPDRAFGLKTRLQLSILNLEIVAFLSAAVTEVTLSHSVLSLPFVRRVVLVGHRLATRFRSRLEDDIFAEWAIVDGRVVAGTLQGWDGDLAGWSVVRRRR